MLYANSNNINNSLKCWDMYFKSPLYDSAYWKKGLCCGNYIRLVQHNKIPLAHKVNLLEALDAIYSFYNMRIDKLKEAGIDISATAAELDFASYILTGRFISGTRIKGTVKRYNPYSQNISEYVLEDERKNYWIFFPDAIIDNSNINIGQRVEYNLVKVQNNMPMVCNLVSI